MRIFTFILSLILIIGCAALNVLGYNGTLSSLEFILITAAAELLLCLILGHFMYRTYANHKRAKSLSQELTKAQAALHTQTQATREAQEAAKAAQAAADAAKNAATAENTFAQDPVPPQATQPLTAPVPEADNDTTTLYKAPLV